MKKGAGDIKYPRGGDIGEEEDDEEDEVDEENKLRHEDEVEQEGEAREGDNEGTNGENEAVGEATPGQVGDRTLFHFYLEPPP